MKVLNLIKTGDGGAWARQQMEQLVLQGEEVHVALPQEGRQLEAYRKAGVNVHFCPVDFSIPRLFALPGQVRALRELFENLKPDIVHSHTLASTLIMRLALKKKGVPLIFQVPGPLHLEYAAYRRAELQTAGNNDYWIGTCQWTRDRYVHSGVDPKRVFLSYYGFPTGNFAAKRTGKLRGILGIGEEVPLAGMVSYVYAPKQWLGHRRGIKGHEDFIQGFARARQSIPELRGAILGGPWVRGEAYFERLKLLSERIVGSAITFLGTRNDVPELYPDFDVVAHPSLSENVGGTGESLISGVPTIATNIGGFTDFVQPCATGWLVPVHDPAAIANAMVEALTDRERAASMAAAGQALVREAMDVRNTSADVHGIHKQVLGN